MRTLAEIKAEAQNSPLEAVTHVQLEATAIKTARNGKPFAELRFQDGSDKLTLRIFDDNPVFSEIPALEDGAFLALNGVFFRNGDYGIDIRKMSFRLLEDQERDALLGGSPEVREKQARDIEDIRSLAATIVDPRLHTVAHLFLSEFGERFARSAGARFVHHARRGGLLEHTAQMMRAAEAVAAVYPVLNRDLLLAGTLLHDAGKMWENHIPPESFTMPVDERGELLGHISIGFELVNTLWRKMQEKFDDWKSLEPSTEQVRSHLLHLIASHHGTYEFGSPVLPKTPEAVALNAIDNLDARLEIFFQGYATLPLVASRIHDKVRILNHYLVKPLPAFEPVNENQGNEQP
ncbi:MAG TPA: HD domain-containing protein [Chthoniobacterales bacterium]